MSSSSVSVARRSCEIILGLLVLHGLSYVEISAQFGDDESFWADTDDFDRIHDKYHGVNEDNCAFKHVGDLKVYQYRVTMVVSDYILMTLFQMPEDVVSHKPDIKEININPVFPNRTALLHLHNMALSRAFFFSYILQSRSDILFLKHDSSIFRQSYNPVCCSWKIRAGSPWAKQHRA